MFTNQVNPIHFDGGTITPLMSEPVSTYSQIDGVAGKHLASGTRQGQLVIVLFNTAGGGELFTSTVTYTEDGGSTTFRASVLLVWLGGEWQLVASQGVTAEQN